MYEYEVQTIYGIQLPPVMTPPRSGFRYRDAKYVESNSNITHSVGYGGVNSTPYSQSSTESRHGHWTIIWERYVPESEGQ